MHELAVTQSILDIAVLEAEKANAKKVLNIKIVIGSMTGLVPEYIQEYYDIVSEDTVAEKAQLIFRRVQAMLTCKECGQESEVKRFRLRCAHCNSNKVNLISGKEFYVESLEVED